MKTINTTFMRTFPLFIVVVGFLFFAFAGNATTYYSNSSSGNDGNTGGSGDPFLSFNASYEAASNGDTINLTGTFDWTDVAEIGDLPTSGFVITKNLVIQGQGAGSTFIQAASSAGTADRRVLSLAPSNTLTLEGLTIRYGHIAGSNVDGGGILAINGSSLTLIQCIVEDNQLEGSNSGYGSEGGGLSCLYCTLSIEDCLLQNNSSLNSNAPTGYGDGGALYLDHAVNVQILNSTFTGNQADRIGSAIWINYVENSIELTNSTMAGNSGGGAVIGGNWGSGNIYLTSNTIAYNTITGFGPTNAIYFSSGTFSGHAMNNLVAQNTGVSDEVFWSTTLVDNGNNLVESQFSTYLIVANGNIIGPQPSLNLSSTLAQNSSFRLATTLELTSGSAAIDAGVSGTNGTVTVPGFDQRNAARVGPPDIGSFEFGGTPLPVELLRFDAFEMDGSVILEWATASEQNNDRFEVYHSLDGESWKFVNTVDGAGNSTERTNYTSEHRSPENGMNYYQLRQIDFDGKFDVFGPVAVLFNKTVQSDVVYPNPSVNYVYTSHSGEYHIVDIKGVDVTQRTSSAGSENGQTIDVSNLSDGMYRIQIGERLLNFSKISK